MIDTTLDQKGEEGGSHWARRIVLVTFCLLLLGTLGVVFTRVVAARVPEQRATLEKLIADRTGLAVRFDNVHFAWNLDGTSAVFERVELTDPARGRVRVVAPELRVEFDTWDYLRHHQFSLGHVTLASPDIEIIGDAIEETAPDEHASRAKASAQSHEPRREDEAALVRRFAAWAELMPNGRVEVEGARVHLKRRGDRAARNTFTLSQAVLIRGASNFNAFGTMLLSQDVGQSLFLSAKLEGLGAPAGVSGDVRVIARRVLLDKLLIQADGRGTLDATLHLEAGRVQSASWQASARELEFDDDARVRFDHFTVEGSLERSADDFLLRFTDLQLTRGSRLERSPGMTARVSLEPGTLRVARTTLDAERMPLMAAEFIAHLVAPQFANRAVDFPGGWVASAGELRDVRFDSGRNSAPKLDQQFDEWTLAAQITGGDFERAHDHARISQFAARLQLDASHLALDFDPANAINVRVPGAHESRALNLEGRMLVASAAEPSVSFAGFAARSAGSSLAAEGAWMGEQPLALTVLNVDRALLLDGWTLLARDVAAPEWLGEVEQGVVVRGAVNLRTSRDASGERVLSWQRSSGKLDLAELASSGDDQPRLTAGRGTLEFSRGHTKLSLEGGDVEQLAVTSARLDWPRNGEPRMHAALQGDLSSSALRRTLKSHGLDRLTGPLSLEADARGEKELRQPDLWRVTARLRDTALPLGGDLPPVEKLAGTLRYSGGQLRGLALEGTWLGGPLEIESRRTTARGPGFAISGVADTGRLLRLLGETDAASRVGGQVSWTGTVQRLDDGDASDAWQLTLASTLTGVESRLPAPFDKPAARALPVSAQLRVDVDGIQDFQLVSGRDVKIHGAYENGVIAGRFEVQGVAGEMRREGSASPKVRIEHLDLKRSPTVLAVLAAMLPENDEIALDIDDMRHANQSFGAVQATLVRRDSGVDFSLDSLHDAPHQLAAQGRCGDDARCRLEFSADTDHLAALLRETQLPAEWPTERLHAAGVLSWPADASGELTQLLTGHFELETQGRDSDHQMLASATLADGEIVLANVQGIGPEADQLFRGSGRVALLAREYDLTVDYERVSLAASAVPTPARARVARAWTALRGSVARRGWAEEPEARRVQWHGTY